MRAVSSRRSRASRQSIPVRPCMYVLLLYSNALAIMQGFQVSHEQNQVKMAACRLF